MNGSRDFFPDLLKALDSSRLMSKRQIVISEGITSNVAKRVIADLLFLDQESNDKIVIFLNSPGGEVTSGFGIFDTIRFITSPVTIVNTGLCASIATVINVSVKKKFRLTMPNTKFLIHQPLIMGRIYGQASDIEITAKDIIKTRDSINTLLSKECGQPIEKVEKDTKRDYWMNASEALEYGLVSKIVKKIKEVC